MSFCINPISVWSEDDPELPPGNGKVWEWKIKPGLVNAARAFTSAENYFIMGKVLSSKNFRETTNEILKCNAIIYCPTPTIQAIKVLQVFEAETSNMFFRLGNHVGTVLIIDHIGFKFVLEMSHEALMDHINREGSCGHATAEECLKYEIVKGLLNAYQAYTAAFRYCRIKENGNCRMAVKGYTPNPRTIEAHTEAIPSGWRLSIQNDRSPQLHVRSLFMTGLVLGFKEIIVATYNQKSINMWIQAGGDSALIRGDCVSSDPNTTEKNPDKYAGAITNIRCLLKFLLGYIPNRDHTILEQTTNWHANTLLQEEFDKFLSRPNLTKVPY